MSQCKFKYVVAINEKEAIDIAPELGLDSYKEAEVLLHDIRKPPTDPFYAMQYRIFAIRQEGT